MTDKLCAKKSMFSSGTDIMGDSYSNNVCRSAHFQLAKKKSGKSESHSTKYGSVTAKISVGHDECFFLYRCS